MGKKKHVSAFVCPLYTCAQCKCKRYLRCTHCGGCAFAWVPQIVWLEVGSLRTRICGFKMRLMESLFRLPSAAHDNGSTTAPAVPTPSRPNKVYKVRTRAHAHLPTITHTTRSRHVKPPPPPPKVTKPSWQTLFCGGPFCYCAPPPPPMCHKGAHHLISERRNFSTSGFHPIFSSCTKGHHSKSPPGNLSPRLQKGVMQLVRGKCHASVGRCHVSA